MFIYNLKVNKKKLTKICILIFIIIALILLAIASSKIFEEIKNTSNNETISVNDSIPQPDIAELTSENYTDILKEVHENLDTYIGQKISFTGYVYRVTDLEENQFILARDMIINSKKQTVIVGFLCSYTEASKFENGTWINITGTIQKGEYYGEIPIIEISEIKETEESEDALVNPPSDSYVPTSVIY